MDVPLISPEPLQHGLCHVVCELGRDGVSDHTGDLDLTALEHKVIGERLEPAASL